ncbi:MAG: GTPase HflX [Verrucomicrobiota bacterium]|nr:GTPase HflX [Verrucomicrobiota bacterium]
MKSLAENHGDIERVFLVGAELKNGSPIDARESLEELAELAGTAGAEIIGDGLQKLDRPHAATFIGKGKAAEFADRCKQGAVDTVIFDDELSPAQTRNLERIFDCKVLDRTALILDIFAQRARTREGKMQIELAQLQHILPRLTRFWTHLSRQKGGIGMRGDGETQLEVDRRRILERISRLRRDLEEVKKHRTTQRRGRQRSHWPLVSIVGYTNAGKSTLLNALTGAAVLAEDKLFATLDPTIRRVRLPTNQNALLSDTVGFIRKLPHQLVESFKATLEEVVEADLLMHIVDAANPAAAEQIAAVNEVLKEIQADDKPTLMVFNKTDLLPARNGNLHWVREHDHAVAISAQKKQGLDELLAELGTMLRPIRAHLSLTIPQSNGQALARIRSIGQVDEEHYEGNQVHLKARIPPHLREEFAPYIQGE